MKKIRIGNDIALTWAIERKDGSPFSLTSLPISLYLKGPYKKEQITNFVVDGNKLSWVYYGKDQKSAGEYSLMLSVNEGNKGMLTTDECNAFQLVQCSCMIGGEDESTLTTESLELKTTVDIQQGTSVTVVVDSALSSTSENPVQNKVITAELEKKIEQEDLEHYVNFTTTESNVSQITHNGESVYPKTSSDAVLVGDNTLTAVLSNKVDKVLGRGLSTNDYSTEDKQQVEKTKSIIPATSNEKNPLADKNFVNSSIQTATAFFRGEFGTWDDVYESGDEYIGYGDNPDFGSPNTNDYMVVRDASGYAPEWKETGRYEVGNYVIYQYMMYKCRAAHNASWEDRPSENANLWEQVESNPNYEGTWRFKYVGVQGDFQKDNWKPEYLINQFPLTREQLYAVNSGITESDVTRLRGLDEVFYAEHGKTTFQAVKDAYNSNKLVWTKHNTHCYTLSYFQDENTIVFARVGDSRSSSSLILNSNNAWSSPTFFYAADYTVANEIEKVKQLIYAAL